MEKKPAQEIDEEEYRLKRFYEILLEADLKALAELLEKRKKRKKKS